MNNIDILEEELRKDILYQIDMQLYDEFNDKFCEINENLGTVYSYKDLEDLKKAESDTERILLRKAISTLIAENKELKDSNVELATTIDCLQTDLKEIKEEYSAEQKHEMENTIPKSKVEAKIEQLDYNDIGNFERRCKREVLQELLGKE